MPDVSIRIPSPQQAELQSAFERWREEWIGSMQWPRVRRSIPTRFVARIDERAFAALPEGILARTLPMLSPHMAVAAQVRDMVFLRNGREQRGTARFAPGTLVYAHAPYSGDGYERVFFTGRDRETGRWATSICDTRRFEGWKRLMVDDAELLFHLATHGVYWNEADLARDLLTVVGAGARDPAAFGWPVELWNRLTRRLLAPERARLPECAAILLGYDEAESRRLSAQSGHLGALLAHAARLPGSASPTKLTRAKAAWTRLAPENVAVTSERYFTRLPALSTGRVGPTPAVTPRPSSLSAVVAWCSDPNGVLEAESLARRIAVVLGSSPELPVLWRITSRSELIGWLRRAPDLSPLDPERASVMCAMRSLVTDVIDARPRRVPSSSERFSDAFWLNAELVALGYALDAIGPDWIELLAPDLPVDAGLQRQLETKHVAPRKQS